MPTEGRACQEPQHSGAETARCFGPNQRSPALSFPPAAKPTLTSSDCVAWADMQDSGAPCWGCSVNSCRRRTQRPAPTAVLAMRLQYWCQERRCTGAWTAGGALKVCGQNASEGGACEGWASWGRPLNPGPCDFSRFHRGTRACSCAHHKRPAPLVQLRQHLGSNLPPKGQLQGRRRGVE